MAIFSDARYDAGTGLPNDKSYLEIDLPLPLQTALDEWKECSEKLDRGEEVLAWDCYYCELQSCINVAEVEHQISPDHAWYLREKFLGLAKELNT